MNEIWCQGRRIIAVTLAALALLAASCGERSFELTAHGPPLPTTPDVVVTQPVEIELPSLGVSAPTIRLGLNDDGTLEVPKDPDDAGWYELGPAPGAPGPAVIAGHVDSMTGPAVFHGLRKLDPGSPIVVSGPEGSVTFSVDRVEQHRKDEFPTEAVYGSTASPELRLITCGGQFDRDEGRYKENTVVFASLAHD